MRIDITRLSNTAQVVELEQEFNKRNMKRSEEYFKDCLKENIAGSRVTLIAYLNGILAGCSHLLYTSYYPFFQSKDIPEINDLNVFPEFRRQGIANQLLARLEEIVAISSSQIGIGVGMYRSYGAAQRLYCRRGYIPDGNGLQYNNEEVVPGSMVKVDDELVLYFIKNID